ncbi:MAG: hypothetical protein LCH54_10270 [Bacteroidetes bacterium]|nr:hypothetical protein [Bacteroidota bacterium]
MDYRLYETIADIAYIAGYKKYYSGDSRVDMSEIISWATKIEEIHKENEWYDQDYMIEVEKYADQKIREQKQFLKNIAR